MGLLFVVSGIGKAAHFGQAEAYMSLHGVPLIPVALTVAMIIEFVCGLILWTGYGTRGAARMLFWYVGLVTLFMHTNNPSPFADPVQMASLLKNLAIMGGLLYMSSFGTEKYVAERRMPEEIRETRKPEVVRR
jgi:putative oxidoreductase